MNFLRKIKNLIETSHALSRIFDWVAGIFLYKKFIYSKIKKYVELIKKTKKFNIMLETTNICNAKCVMCPHTKITRKLGVMSDEMFDLLVRKLKDDKIDPMAFIVNGFGDPLTDRKIFERIKILRGNFSNSVLKFYTNLGLANDEIIENLLNSDLDEVNISFNGYDKENYERTMKIDYDKTLANLNKLIDKRKKKNNNNLKIRISMTLVSNNDGDEKKFIEEWEHKVDSVSVNKVHSYGQAVSDVSGKNKINFNKLAYPCKYIWNTINISVNGDIYLCCLDYDGNYNFGNIKDKGILEIFYSDGYERVRKKHLENNIKNIKICSTCSTAYRNGTEWLISELY
jgi:radical SAM protein with 4Fe4S-binding SPASM domain